MNSLETIRMYFNRDATFDKSDSVTICPLDKYNKFRIYYQIPECGTHSKNIISYNLILEKENLINYINNLLTMIQYDHEPFKTIQFDIPTYPTILVEHKDLTTLKHTIISSIDLLLKNSNNSLFDSRTDTKPLPIYVDSDDDDKSYVCI